MRTVWAMGHALSDTQAVVLQAALAQICSDALSAVVPNSR